MFDIVLNTPLVICEGFNELYHFVTYLSFTNSTPSAVLLILNCFMNWYMRCRTGFVEYLKTCDALEYETVEYLKSLLGLTI